MDNEHARKVIHALARMKRENMAAMGEAGAGEIDPADSDAEVLHALEAAEAALEAQISKEPGPSETRPKRRMWNSFRDKR